MKKKSEEKLDLSANPVATEKEIKAILKHLSEEERFTVAYYIAKKEEKIKTLTAENFKLTLDKERLLDLLLREVGYHLTEIELRQEKIKNEAFNSTFDFLFTMKGKEND